MNNNKSIFIVTGMHRSGTSMIARSLKVLGLDYGTNLLRAEKNNNDFGFYEDIDVLTFNEKLLEHLKKTWISFSIINKDLLDPEIPSKFYLEAKKIIKTKLINGVNLIKDPRFSILIFFWKKVFEELSIDTKYIFCLRNPLSVASSLKKRDGLEIKYGLDLWLSYCSKFTNNLPKSSYSIIEYERMLNSPREEIMKVSKNYNLNFDERQFKYFNKRFLRQKLNRNPIDLKIYKEKRKLNLVAFNFYENLKIKKVNSTVNIFNENKKNLKFLEIIDKKEFEIYNLKKKFNSNIYDENIKIEKLLFSKKILQEEKKILQEKIDNIKNSNSYKLYLELKKLYLELKKLFRRLNNIYLSFINFFVKIKKFFLYFFVKIKKFFFYIYKFFISKNKLFISYLLIRNILKIFNKECYESILAKMSFYHKEKYEIKFFFLNFTKHLKIKSLSLIFDHNGGGGSYKFSKKKIDELLEKYTYVIRIIYIYDKYICILHKKNSSKIVGETNSIRSLFISLGYSFDLIEINSLYGFPKIDNVILEIIKCLKINKNIKINYYFNDFYSICASPHLLDKNYKYCGIPKNLKICNSCLKSNAISMFYHPWVKNRVKNISLWRSKFAKLFKYVNKIVLFDKSSLKLLTDSNLINRSKCFIEPHIYNEINFLNKIKKVKKKPINIGILGNLTIIKGLDKINELARYIVLKKLNVNIIVFGGADHNIHKKVKIVGGYKVNNLNKLIKKYKINCFFLSSIVPETFSYALSEAMKFGLPIISYSLGAQKNRLMYYKKGLSLNINSKPSTIINNFRKLIKSK